LLYRPDNVEINEDGRRHRNAAFRRIHHSIRGTRHDIMPPGVVVEAMMIDIIQEADGARALGDSPDGCLALSALRTQLSTGDGRGSNTAARGTGRKILAAGAAKKVVCTPDDGPADGFRCNVVVSI
jgi:hypothetical protein